MLLVLRMVGDCIVLVWRYHRAVENVSAAETFYVIMIIQSICYKLKNYLQVSLLLLIFCIWPVP